MKLRILIGVLAVITFSGCQSLLFDRYPGTVQSEFPEQMRGRYEFYDQVLAPDTVDFYVGKNSFTQMNKDEVKITFLDPEDILSVYKNQYFLFRKEQDRWAGIALKYTANEIQLIPIDAANKKYTKYFSDVKLVEDPQNKEVKNYQVKMNEEELMKYLKKRKNKQFVLKRVEY